MSHPDFDWKCEYCGEGSLPKESHVCLVTLNSKYRDQNVFDEVNRLKLENERFISKIKDDEDRWLASARANEILLTKLAKFEVKNKKLIDCLNEINNQNGQTYGMLENQAVHFRCRKIFSLVHECLEELKE